MAERKRPSASDEALSRAKKTAVEQSKKAQAAEAKARGAKASEQVARKQLRAVKETRKDGVQETYHKKDLDDAFLAGVKSGHTKTTYAGDTPSPGGGEPGTNKLPKSEPADQSPPPGQHEDIYKLGHNPDENLRQTAAKAAEIFNNQPGRSNNDKHQAVELALSQLQRNSPVHGPDMSETTHQSVYDYAFGAKPVSKSSTLSDSRPEQVRKLDAKMKAADRSQMASYQGSATTIPSGHQLKDGSRTLYGGQPVPKARISTKNFMQGVDPEELQWIQSQMGYVKDPVSGEEKPGLFQGMQGNQVPGAYRRWQQYVNARQAGYKNRDNITTWLQYDGRGKSTHVGQGLKKPNQGLQSRYTEGITDSGGTRAQDRYGSLAPSHEDFGGGMRTPGIQTKAQLKAKNPNASDDEIFGMQHAQRQNQLDFMDNQRMSHEARIRNALGKERTNSSAENDRVVFFTTSVGSPAISVPANSLVGQYIIRKRKQMLVDTRTATRAQVKGDYPDAVRDQHVVEVATGLNLGVQGRYGVFKHVGWRAGTKASKGFGKPTPVGAQVLVDSNGQPVYDSSGNIRYTQGYTRPFDVRSSNELGLRVYLG